MTIASGFSVDLTDITFDFDSRNSSGGLQGATAVRNIVFDMTIDGSTYGSQQGGDVTGGVDYLATFSEALTLAEGVHTLVITADGTGPGVFAPIDDLSINGSVVPEPSSAILIGLSGLALIRRRRN
ncbi:PEP-CTERM sorting domain-containing protein [Akkermansiaceae bacterium]|nr:PEP-CTERM sorting domain-containing protein [Akkermansiaceae bacterium]